MIDPGVIGYVRLSRDEEREKDVSMEEKILLRKQILLTIAKFNNVELSENQIVVELMSGGSIDERAGLIDILERCRRRDLHTVICFDIDRLTRDVADLKHITQAFFRGDVTLITQRGVHQFDRNYDTTMIQILAILGEKERRSFSFRRKAANEERARRGQKSGGFEPYGYQWDAQHKCYQPHPLEYPIVEEIFRRTWIEGARTLSTDLTTRGIVPPGAGKTERGNLRNWSQGTVRNITANPIYTGYLVKRLDVDREGATLKLPVSRWIWSEQPLQTLSDTGEWTPLPHPINRDDWERLQEIRAGRRISTPNAGLLTGLIFCSAGKSMCRKGRHYACNCKSDSQPHDGMHIQRAMIEPVICQLIANLLADLAAKPPSRKPAAPADTFRLETERRAILRDLREKEETLQDLIGRSSFYRRLPHYGTSGPDGVSAFDRTLETLSVECAQLTARATTLADEIEQIQRVNASPAMLEIARAGLTAQALQSMPFSQARRIISQIVRRMRLEAPGAKRAMTRTIHVETYPLTPNQQTHYIVSVKHANAGGNAGSYQPHPNHPTPK